jgi:hypothetical protein
MMGRDTFENWQSEFLQLLWQVVGLAYFLYVGSPASKENDDRTEAKLDALLQLVGKERGEALIREIDATHERRGGHAASMRTRRIMAERRTVPINPAERADRATATSRPMSATA